MTMPLIIGLYFAWCAAEAMWNVRSPEAYAEHRARVAQGR